MIDKKKWDLVTEGPDADVYRLKVPGGWLVRTSSYANAAGDLGGASVSISCAICFYPDPAHAWAG